MFTTTPAKILFASTRAIASARTESELESALIHAELLGMNVQRAGNYARLTISDAPATLEQDVEIMCTALGVAHQPGVHIRYDYEISRHEYRCYTCHATMFTNDEQIEISPEFDFE